MWAGRTCQPTVLLWPKSPLSLKVLVEAQTVFIKELQMSLGLSRSTAGLVGLVVLATACEPASILEARDQLGRGGERTIVFELPIIDTVFQVETLLEDSDLDTLASGILAVVMEPESVSVGFGEALEFQNINLDTLAVSFPPAALAVPPGTQIPFSVAYDGLASDTILDDVDTVVVYSGVLSVTTSNRLPIPISYTATLNGFMRVGGAPLVGSGTVPGAPGDGTYRSDVLVFDLAGVTVVPQSVNVSVVGSGTVGGTPISAGLGDSAIVQSGGIATLEVQSVAGQLDPAETPELTISVEEIEEIPEADLDLGDLEDAIDSSTINHATISLTLDNGTGVLALFSNFNLGVVNLDAAGNVPRDGAGDPIFEEDAGGAPILVSVADPGESTLTLAASGTSSVELDAAPLVDRLVHLLLDDERVAIVAAGDVAVGDGSQARVNRTDSVSVELEMAIGLDFTIPAGGVSFTRNTTQTGLEMEPEDADQLVDRLDSAGVVTDAVNNTPFGVEVDIAFVEDSLGEDVDIFTYPGAVILTTIALSAPSVDASGLVTAPSTDIVSISLTGEQARQLTGDHITASVRARLLPGSGSGGRGAIRASDEISLNSRARIVLRSGGGGQ